MVKRLHLSTQETTEKFTGKELDKDGAVENVSEGMGLNYFGWRYYDPVVGYLFGLEHTPGIDCMSYYPMEGIKKSLYHRPPTGSGLKMYNNYEKGRLNHMSIRIWGL